MLREMLALFRQSDAMAEMGDNFSRMLDLTEELTRAAGEVLFDQPATPDDRTSISKRDIEVNKLQRRIRRQIIAHLSLADGDADAPHCLLLMSLVKDVERIGDYCKNLAEIYDVGGGPIPEDDNADELREIRSVVEATFAETGDVFTGGDAEKALDLIRRSREVNQRCDALVTRIARSPYDAATTTTMVLAARYYKRICSHLMNVLSGVVMPLHKLDYYDEDSIPPGAEGDDE